MPSPFPGVDPFLELKWKDFHGAFNTFLKGALNPLLPPNLVAEMEADIYIHELSAEERGFEPRRRRFAAGDGVVSSAPPGSGGGGGTATALAAAPTALGRLPGVVEERVTKVLIRDVAGEDVVTVLELLSPTNKVRHRDAYLMKRNVLLDSEVHLVEIDLLRAGRRLPIDDCPDSDFLVTVSVADRRPTVELYTFDLRDAMPVIPVPLRDGAFVPLDLRAVTDRVFEVSAYEKRLYARPPEPPLSPADAAWAAEVLAAAGHPPAVRVSPRPPIPRPRRSDPQCPARSQASTRFWSNRPSGMTSPTTC